MQAKRFVAADMRRALELVRLELGPDAVILSNKRQKDGVEIMATAEMPAQVPEAERALQPHVAQEEGAALHSDGAWGEQAKMRQALSAEAGAELVSSVEPRQQNSLSAERTQQLAQEIERARERVLAARKAEREQQKPYVEAPVKAAPVVEPVAPVVAEVAPQQSLQEKEKDEVVC